MLQKNKLFALARSAVLGATVMVALPAAMAAVPVIAPLDLGATAPTVTETVSLILKIRNAEQLDEFIAASVDPESGQYHRFLSVDQFRSRYAPSARQIKQVTDYLMSLGIVVNEVYDNHLVIKATGTAAQFNQAFTTTLHDYEDKDGKVFQKPEGDHGVPELL